MSAKTHLIFFHLLSDSLYLHDEDFEAIRKEWPVYSYEHIKGRLIRSVPGRALRDLLRLRNLRRRPPSEGEIKADPLAYLIEEIVTDTPSLIPIFDGVLMSAYFDWPTGIHYTTRMFDYDLKGVPGFYYHDKDLIKDISDNQQDNEARMSMLWRLNTPQSGILKPYYDDRGRIIGIFIYHNPKDELPRLLSSAGMCLGTPAAPVPPSTSRSLL